MSFRILAAANPLASMTKSLFAFLRDAETIQEKLVVVNWCDGEADNEKRLVLVCAVLLAESALL
jgi:hypothetical protein